MDALKTSGTLALSKAGDTLMPDGYVHHVASALLALAEAETEPGERVFVCGGEDLRPKDVVQWAAAALGLAQPQLVAAPPGAPADRTFPGADLRLSRARGNGLGLLLGGRAAEGVAASARWYRDRAEHAGGGEHAQGAQDHHLASTEET